MSTPTTVCIDNDFTTCNASITLWSTNDEATRWLDMVDGAFIEETLWNNFSNNLFHYFFTEGFRRDLFRMLSRDDYSVNPKRD